MTRYIVFIILFIVTLQSCSTRYIEPGDIHDIESNNNALNKIISGDNHLYQLIYKVDDAKFIYTTYEINDRHKFLQITTKDNNVYSISTIPLYDAYWPGIRNCTQFPFHDYVDVNQCLKEFNSKMKSMYNNLWKNEIFTTDQHLKQQQERERTGAIFMAGTIAVLAAPMIIPTAAIATPLAATAESYSESEKEFFSVKLSEIISDDLISRINNEYVSLKNNTGTIFIYGSPFSGEKSFAFGLHESNVIWIQHGPKGLCGGGYMYWGDKCIMGNHKDDHLK